MAQPGVSENSLPSGSASSTPAASVLGNRVAPRATRRSSLGSQLALVHREGEALPVPALLRCERWAAPGDLRAAGRGLDRGLLVLVPDERPAERLRPEVADLSAAVTGNLAEEAAPGQEPVARLDHAEGVALRIGEHDVAFVWQLPDIEMVRPELESRRDRLLLTGGSGAGEVEMDAVRPDLVGLARGEQQTNLSCRSRQQDSPVVGDGDSPEHPLPEVGQAIGIAGVEGHGLQ